tara:strand:- start:1433 stop:1873 length:441 start_codon:yes stop_codon:yes gene_type:complete
MSVSNDFIMSADISYHELSDFLTNTCELIVKSADNSGMPVYRCDDFNCFLIPVSDLCREIIKENFDFIPRWDMRFYLNSLPHHDTHRRMIETMQLIMLEYDSDNVWLINNESPQLLRRDGVITILGEHSQYSHWADYLRRIVDDLR